MSQQETFIHESALEPEEEMFVEEEVGGPSQLGSSAPVTPDQIAAGLRSQFQVQLPNGITYPDDIIRAIFYLFRQRDASPEEIEAWRQVAADELANFIEGFTPAEGVAPGLGAPEPDVMEPIAPAAEEVVDFGMDAGAIVNEEVPLGQ